MRRSARLTLVELFVVATLATAGAVGAVFYAFVDATRKEIVARSEAARDMAARHVDERMTAELRVPLDALGDVERAVHLGLTNAEDPDAVEERLFSELIDHPTLSEVALTHATFVRDKDQPPRLAPDGHWQVSVYRTPSAADGSVESRRVAKRNGAFVSQVRQQRPGGGLLDVPLPLEAAASDPTEHGTFVETVSRRSYGKAIWSDLSWTEVDQALPADQQRIVVTVQKAVEDPHGELAGVVRVGLLVETIDALLRAASAEAPQSVILCDAQGQLVTRGDPADPIAVVGDDLRVRPQHLPPEISAALAIAPRSEPIEVGGTRYLVTFRRLKTSQHWSVGVIVPEDYYTRDLRMLRDRFLWTFAVTVAIVLLAGWLVLRLLRRSLGRIVDATARMRRFDFSPSAADAPLREVASVMEGVERVKTSMRALGKYAPIQLVRQLYESNEEPRLGGEMTEVSLLFTDIEGFTSLAERLPPDRLATALGAYLQTMTQAIGSTGGSIDKFIGDAVMAFWNAPAPQADHARRACRATLASIAATRALYASDAWMGLPPLFTRHGLHRARVLVGHFGAPDRFNYTCLGDGVNLAARLEPLCKQYGVAVLASETIVQEAGDAFLFRLIDRVAVKGKNESVRVYELLGAAGDCDPALVVRARRYEDALAAYFARDFAAALATLLPMLDDPPSRVLADRCRAMAALPPPADWDGVHVASSK